MADRSAVTASKSTTNSMDITANIDKTQETPFFLPYNTPHDTVPFDRIKTEHYEEAFMEGIRRDDEAIDKLINDPEEPTFENTLTRVDLINV